MLVREVEAGRFVEATEAHYADDASTYELTGLVTEGKAALLAKERDYLSTIEKWNRIEAVDVLVDGQIAAIHRKFEITIAGKRMTREEISLQHWSGDGANARIVREQYFTATPKVLPVLPPRR